MQGNVGLGILKYRRIIIHVVFSSVPKIKRDAALEEPYCAMTVIYTQ